MEQNNIIRKITGAVLTPRLTPENSYALVLSGGGTRGAYEIGVWKALKELRIPIGGVCGTSIGAINGALFLTNTVRAIEKIYLNIRMDDIVEVNDSVNREKDLMAPENIRAMVGKFLNQGGLSNEALANLISGHIDVQKIYRSPLDFGLVTVDIKGRKPVELFKDEIAPEKMHEYILSSANFPIFKPVKSEEKALIDGGLYDNMPINMMIRRGFKKIIAVDIDGTGHFPPITDPSVYVKRIVFTEDLGGVFEFNHERIERNIKMGYFDALKAFRRVDGFFHYFTRVYFRKLLDYFDLETLRGIEKATQLYKIDRYQLIKDDSFLKTVAAQHKEAVARYQATKSTNWLTTLIQDPRRITEMIDDGIILGWAQEQRDSAARIQKNWLTDLMSDYFAAAKGMTELENYLQEARE